MKTMKKLFSVLLSVLLCVGLIVPNAAARVQAGERSSTTGSGLIVNKTATLEDDGTYTFNLEAFATGETVKTASTTPVDVVLVLDLSNSMTKEDQSASSKTTYTLATNKKASDEPELYHQCSDGTYHKVTWTSEWNILSTTYTWTCTNCSQTASYTSSFVYDPTVSGLYEQKVSSSSDKRSRLEAMQDAADTLVDSIAEKNAVLEDNQKHRVAVVKYSGESTDTVGNDTYEYKYGYGSQQISYTFDYSQIVKQLTVITNENKESFKSEGIDALEAHDGPTRTDLGLAHAQSILEAARTPGRQQVVILLSDGEPTGSDSKTWGEYQKSVAGDAVDKAKTMKAGTTNATTGKKEYQVTIYTIGIGPSTGDSTINPDDTTKQNFNIFLNGVSSNYPNAAKHTNSGWGDSNTSGIDLNTGSNQGYYKTVSGTKDLTDIFQEIEGEITSTTVTLDENAVLRDVIADGFALPDGFSKDANVDVKVCSYTGRDSSGLRQFAAGQTLSDASVTINKGTNTIDVKGFSYKDNYVADATATETVRGKKLVVTITGVEATDALVTNEILDTNKETSGIYADQNAEEAVALFPVPDTILTSKSYVLDYAKPVTVSSADWDQVSNLKLSNDMKKATAACTPKYGSAAAGANTTDSDGNAAGYDLTFTPKTMNWAGYDSVYALGRTADADILAASANAVNKNVWTKINFIPANNVYYEDDFETNESTGTVGIVYTGNWNTEGTVSGNTETPNTEIHGGWQNGSLADDKTFTDGSAHVSSTKKATAEFTFTGTGVDIYSYTDNLSGVISVRLYKAETTDDDTEQFVMSQWINVDNYADSGEYYQIPTAHFTGLEYGKYKVKITVGAVDNSDGTTRSTYYLDGIRIYNPIGEEDDTVQSAYGDETNATFTTIRETLLADGLTADTASANGTVFIDQTEDASGTTTNAITVYKKYGPKNEVYLGKNQAIAFKVSDAEAKYSIGLKSITGAETTASVSMGSAKTNYAIAHTADLYYALEPNSDGLVVIQNTTDNVLAVTKLKTAGGAAITEADVVMLMSYVDTFDTLKVVDTEKPVEDQTPDVDIKDDTTEQEKPVSTIQNLIKNIFESLRNWFRR